MTEDGMAPQPVPSLTPEAGVTDEDRNRYGHLLDRAAERGLINSYEYEVRLRDLAAATSVEELNRIVTELPAFAAVPAASAGSRPRHASWTAWSGRRGGSGRPGPSGLSGRPTRRSSPWLLLVIMVAIVAASLVFLALFAEHLARTHHSGLRPAAAATVSALRL